MDWDAFWADVTAFFAGPWGVPLRVVLVVIGAILVRAIAIIVINRTVQRIVKGAKRRHGVEDTQLINPMGDSARVVQRTRALGGILSGAVTGLVAISSVVIIISIVAPDATAAFALITAALGAGLGFGAQSIVRDILAGIFLVSEDQFGVGDRVDLGTVKGKVESVDIRITRVRSEDGTLWVIPNGEIRHVGNMSQSRPPRRLPTVPRPRKGTPPS